MTEAERAAEKREQEWWAGYLKARAELEAAEKRMADKKAAQ